MVIPMIYNEHWLKLLQLQSGINQEVRGLLSKLVKEHVDVGVKIVILGHIIQIPAGGSVVFATLELLRRQQQVKERNSPKQKNAG